MTEDRNIKGKISNLNSDIVIISELTPENKKSDKPKIKPQAISYLGLFNVTAFHI